MNKSWRLYNCLSSQGHILQGLLSLQANKIVQLDVGPGGKAISLFAFWAKKAQIFVDVPSQNTSVFWDSVIVVRILLSDLAL